MGYFDFLGQVAPSQDAADAALQGALEADRQKTVAQQEASRKRTIPKLTPKSGSPQDPRIIKLKELQKGIASAMAARQPLFSPKRELFAPGGTLEEKYLKRDPIDFIKTDASKVRQEIEGLGEPTPFGLMGNQPRDLQLAQKIREAESIVQSIEADAPSVKAKQEEMRREQAGGYTPQIIEPEIQKRGFAEKITTVEPGIQEPNLFDKLGPEVRRGFFDNLKDLGIEPAHWKESVVKGMDAMGLKESDWGRTVPFDLALRRAMEVLDPQRIIASQILKDTKAEEPVSGEEGEMKRAEMKHGGIPVPSRQDKINQEIDAKRTRLRGLFQELRQRHFMTTWIGVVSYVLLALSTKSPVFAAQLLLRLSGHDAVEMEIRGLQSEIRDDLRTARDEEDRELRERQFAASMILRQQMQERSIEADIGKLQMQNDMKIASAAEKNPELEAALKGLQRDFRNYSVLATKYGTAARDPMTGEIRDKNAERLYQGYLKKMQDVQAEIEKFE